MIILENLEHAQKRGARIYGEVVGFGASCNTHSWKEADPKGRGIAMAARGLQAEHDCQYNLAFPG